MLVINSLDKKTELQIFKNPFGINRATSELHLLNSAMPVCICFSAGNVLSRSHLAEDYLGRLHYIWQLHSQGQLVPIFVPSADQLADTITKPPSEATFNSLWTHIGVGDMVFRGIICNDFSIWLLFSSWLLVSCDIMSSLCSLLFRLRGDVEYMGAIFIFG